MLGYSQVDRSGSGAGVSEEGRGMQDPNVFKSPMWFPEK